MSIPIKVCRLRKALDDGDWDKLKEDMKYNNSFGIFTLIGCRGHLFKKKCLFTEEENKIINKQLYGEDAVDSK